MGGKVIRHRIIGWKFKMNRSIYKVLGKHIVMVVLKKGQIVVWILWIRVGRAASGR